MSLVLISQFFPQLLTLLVKKNNKPDMNGDIARLREIKEYFAMQIGACEAIRRIICFLMEKKIAVKFIKQFFVVVLFGIWNVTSYIAYSLLVLK